MRNRVMFLTWFSGRSSAPLTLKETRLREAHENGSLGRADVMDILAEKAAPTKTGRYFAKGELDRYRGKFSSVEAMEKAIINFLEHYESG